MKRIKTLSEIDGQRDRVAEYLTAQGRYSTACKVDEVFNRTFDRILAVIGITEIDDESNDMAMEEPVFVSEYQRLP